MNALQFCVIFFYEYMGGVYLIVFHFIVGRFFVSQFDTKSIRHGFDLLQVPFIVGWLIEELIRRGTIHRRVDSPRNHFKFELDFEVKCLVWIWKLGLCDYGNFFLPSLDATGKPVLLKYWHIGSVMNGSVANWPAVHCAAMSHPRLGGPIFYLFLLDSSWMDGLLVVE
jgi:hypothetical protein